MPIIVNPRGGDGSSGSTGAGSIARDMYFANTTERDTFATDNPERIYQGVTCAVTNGSVYDYYQWSETEKGWKDANLIFQGRSGNDGRSIDDATIEGKNLTLYFSDGGEADVGKVVGDDGVGVSAAEILPDGHLRITLSDGGTIDAGVAKGKDGDLIYDLLAVETYGDFFSADWLSKGTNIYGVTGLGGQFANSPYPLNAATTYSFEILLVNEPNQYSLRVTSMSNADFANSGRESILAGNTKTAAESIGWKTLAFTGDAGHVDPADGFDLKPNKNMGMDSTSALMIKNNAGDYHNAVDQDVDLDAIRLGSPSMKTYLRTNGDHIQVQTTDGLKTVAHVDDIPELTTADRFAYWVREPVYTLSEDQIQKEILLMCQPESRVDTVKNTKIVFPDQATFQKHYYIPDVNEEDKNTKPHIETFRFAIWLYQFTDPSSDAKVEMTSVENWLPFVSSSSLSEKRGIYLYRKSGNTISQDLHTFAFMRPLSFNPSVGVQGWSFQNAKPEMWTALGDGVPADNLLAEAQNLNLRNDELGNVYLGIDRQSPVKTTDVTTEKFRLIRIVASETTTESPTIKKIQPPEIGSGFSFFLGEDDKGVGSGILQISSGTYTLEALGIDSAGVSYGDEIYIQPDGSIGKEFSRYQCGWVIDGGVILDIDLYNASALSEGGFPTDPNFNSVTTNNVRSSISPNNYLHFNGNIAELKTNQDIELNPSTALKFKVGNTQKAILTAIRLDMGDTPVSNVPDAVLDKDAANWKQIRDYVDTHSTPVPDDLNVNSVTATSFVDTPVLKSPSTQISMQVGDTEVAEVSLGSFDLSATANTNNGTNVTGVYKIIGADSTSHIAIPNANMVLHAKETVAFQDQGSDYLYVDRSQGIIFAGTSSGVIPDYSGNGAYLKGNKVGIRNWSGNDVISIDKALGDVINVNSHRVENVLAPVFDTDATNKKFVTDIQDGFESRIATLEGTVAEQEQQISGLLSSIISLNQDVSELIESNKQSVTNFVMYSETANTLRMDMDRIGGQGLTQTIELGSAPVPPNPEPPLPDEVAVYYGWDINEMADMQAADFLSYQGTDERTANLYITADTLLTTALQITRSNTERYKYSYIAYPKGLVDPDPLKVSYSGFVDDWNHREMVIEGHTYIVLVPEYPNIHATMDMKLSY